MNAEFIEGLGELIAMSFGILELLGNGFNWLIIAIITIMVIIWIRMMGRYNREAQQNGTLK